VFPGGIGLRDPRSQKRDLGHPSVSPFDIAEGTGFVISLPTRLSESAWPGCRGAQHPTKRLAHQTVLATNTINRISKTTLTPALGK
jgi:hypothetical protein